MCESRAQVAVTSMAILKRSKARKTKALAPENEEVGQISKEPSTPGNQNTVGVCKAVAQSTAHDAVWVHQVLSDEKKRKRRRASAPQEEEEVVQSPSPPKDRAKATPDVLADPRNAARNMLVQSSNLRAKGWRRKFSGHQATWELITHAFLCMCLASLHGTATEESRCGHQTTQLSCTCTCGGQYTQLGLLRGVS